MGSGCVYYAGQSRRARRRDFRCAGDNDGEGPVAEIKFDRRMEIFWRWKVCMYARERDVELSMRRQRGGRDTHHVAARNRRGECS